MDIKDFIKTTLRELSEALSESNTELGKRVSVNEQVSRISEHIKSMLH